jgi:hypothetical protein
VAAVLIVDPDPATAALLELLVLRLGHRPIVRREPDEGETLDLVLLEPAAGAAFRQALQLRRRFPRLPILCVSIDPPGEETARLGPAGHVMKPFRLSELEAAIVETLGAANPEAVHAEYTA